MRKSWWRAAFVFFALAIPQWSEAQYIRCEQCSTMVPCPEAPYTYCMDVGLNVATCSDYGCWPIEWYASSESKKIESGATSMAQAVPLACSGIFTKSE